MATAIQSHYYLEHNSIVPKHQSIIYSRGVLFFYVNRRFQNVAIDKMLRPCSFARLPMTIAGFEKLNDTPVIFQQDLDIHNEKYLLRSVVCVDTAPESATAALKNLIVGTSTLFIKPRNYDKGMNNPMFLIYDPLGAAYKDKDEKELPKPISYIPETVPLNDNDVDTIGFTESAQRRGTIFIYQKGSERSCDPFETDFLF